MEQFPLKTAFLVLQVAMLEHQVVRMACSLDPVFENQSGKIFCQIVKMRLLEQFLVDYSLGQLCALDLNLLKELSLQEVVLVTVHWQ